MRGDNESLFRHLASGLQLISAGGRKHRLGDVGAGYRLDDNAENQIIEDSLILQFSLLDLQVTMYEPDWVPCSVGHYAQPDKSQSFCSMEQARHRLTALLLRMIELKRLEGRQDDKNKETVWYKRESLLADLI